MILSDSRITSPIEAIDPRFSEIVTLAASCDDPHAYMVNTLIPAMHERKGKPPEQDSDVGVYVEKLFSQGPKMGEMYELLEYQGMSNPPLEEIALEIADIAYYSVRFYPRYFYEFPDHLQQLEIFGCSFPTAFRLSILKYEARLLFGDYSDYKRIESLLMREFLKNVRWIREEIELVAMILRHNHVFPRGGTHDVIADMYG